MTCWKVTAVNPSLPVTLRPLEERPDAGADLPLFFRPLAWFPFLGQAAECFDPFIGCRLLSPEIEQIHMPVRINTNHDMHSVIATVCGYRVVTRPINSERLLGWHGLI